jgi:hypothetical protein
VTPRRRSNASTAPASPARKSRQVFDDGGTRRPGRRERLQTAGGINGVERPIAEHGRNTGLPLMRGSQGVLPGQIGTHRTHSAARFDPVSQFAQRRFHGIGARQPLGRLAGAPFAACRVAAASVVSRKFVCIWPPVHPVPRHCSSVKYSGCGLSP